MPPPVLQWLCALVGEQMMMNRNMAVATAVCLAVVWGTSARADGGPVPDEPAEVAPAEIEEPMVEEPQAAPVSDPTLGDHAYLTVFGGVSFGNRIDFSLSEGSDIGDVGLDQGFVLGGALGKSFKTSSSISIRVELEGSFRNLNTEDDTEFHESGAGIAYQGGAGLYAKVAENFAVGVHYRYFVADVDTTFRSDLIPNTEVANKLTSHEISGSITLFF
jgi:hypothetical protein